MRNKNVDLKRLLEDWNEEKRVLQVKAKIKAEKQVLKGAQRRLSTTKMLIWFIFLSCTFIELFTGWATVATFNLAKETGITPDLTPLITLIGCTVGEIISFAIYSIKSTKENTVGGIVYDSAMKEGKE